MENTQDPKPSPQLAALAIMLDRPHLAADPRLLCSTARVCTSWRAAVAASGCSSSTDAILRFNNPTRTAATAVMAVQAHMWLVTNFAAWLSKHASLVRSITLQGLARNIPVTPVAACQTLAMALQSAAAGPRPLRLLMFSCDVASPHRATAALLRVLPDCLTQLEVGATECLPSSPTEAAAAVDSHVLARLTRLRHLVITPGYRGTDNFLQPQALAPLTALTHLELTADCTQEALGQFEGVLTGMPTLQHLQLHLQCPGAASSSDAVCQVQAMTALTSLHLRLRYNAFSGATLPPQLQDLSLILEQLPEEYNAVTELKLKRLKQLKRLRLTLTDGALTEMPEGLAPVQMLTQLDSLELSYNAIPKALADHTFWSSLPKITGLRIIDAFPDTYRQFQGSEQTFLPSVQQLQHLTCLQLTLTCSSPEHEPSDVCRFLSGLVSLQHLELVSYGGDVTRHDCMKLVTLNRLTHLLLGNLRQAVGDTVAVALASSMPRLQSLELVDCHLGSEIVMPALARLQHLSELGLGRNRFDNNKDVCQALIEQLRDPSWPKLAVEWHLP